MSRWSDALAVREGERLGRRIQKVDSVEQRARGEAASLLLFEDVLERCPVEPLEHHVRDVRAARRVERPDVPGLDDRSGARRELAEERSFLDERVEEVLLLALGQLA